VLYYNGFFYYCQCRWLYKNAAKGQRGFGGIQIHDQREKGVSHTNEDIDWDRVHLNYDLHNGDNKINFADKINERIASLDLKKALRKDANVMAQIFISASPEWFRVLDENNKDEDGKSKVLYEIDPEIQRKYFRDAYKWVCERYGAENIISAMVHLDEATPHMHINLVPVVNGKVCYADLFTEKPQKSRGRNGGQLTALHDDFHKHNQSCGYDLERGELQSVMGKKEHLSVLDFKKQEREKEVEELKATKEQVAKSVSELQNTAAKLQNDINDLETERGQMEGLKIDLQEQIKTERKKLQGVEGKIKTKQGVEKIIANAGKTLGGYRTLTQENLNDLKRTALASTRIETEEALKMANSEAEELKKSNESLQKAIKNKNAEIRELEKKIPKPLTFEQQKEETQMDAFRKLSEKERMEILNSIWKKNKQKNIGWSEPSL